MLPRRNKDHLGSGSCAQLMDDRSNLNCFGSSTRKNQEFLHINVYNYNNKT